MLWFRVLVILSVIATTRGINRPVYKVVLAQKGFAQFLQYDVETPPLVEFTFCTWVRLYNLDREQTIFTYIVKGNRNMVRLWLDSGGRNIQLTINGWLATTSPIEVVRDVWKHVCVSYQSDYGAWALYVDARLVTCGASQAVDSAYGLCLWMDSGGRNIQLTINGWLATTSPIEVVRDVWKHVCVSYQSDYGAWALYVDAKLVTCGASQALNGFVLPPGGSVIIGYGTSDNGAPSGMEGEIFGANMILVSSIERNYTMKLNPRFKQKNFNKNKIQGNKEETFKYIVLSDLRGNKIQNTFENKLVGFKGLNFTTYVNLKDSFETSNEKDILDFAVPGRVATTTSDPIGIQFWNLIDTTRGDARSKKKSNNEPFGSGTRDLPTVSEFETPPPPNAFSFDYMKEKSEKLKPMAAYENKMSEKYDSFKKSLKPKEPSEVETPPPPQKDDHVYGQWVSSKFAGSVLNHLRSMRFKKEPPATIPLYKTSDAFPYASEFKLTKLRPPAQFQRRSFIDNQFYAERTSKRRPQYSVQILEDDIRDRILKSHSRLKPMNIDVVNVGEPTHYPERTNRFYRQTDDVDVSTSSTSSESIEIDNSPRPFSTKTPKTTTTTTKPTEMTLSQSTKKVISKNDLENLLTILPFLKTLEIFKEDSDKTESNNVLKSNIYTRSLADGNKWHNTKSYSNDYTPRQFNLEPNAPLDNIENKLLEANKNKYPAVKLKYKHEGRKETVDSPIARGRVLAKDISSHANAEKDSVSIQQFIYESLPNESKNKEKDLTKPKLDMFYRKDFNKHIKIGNALNERDVIGKDDLQKKRSFEGGDARVPDINRYRSDIDKEKGPVPPSLSPKVCKNVELYDRVLYIQPDESVDLTHFMSPVKLKNIAIEFIQQNYKSCSLEGSAFEKDPLLYLDWSKTPVRLFGGAYLKTTTDLCGFF